MKKENVVVRLLARLGAFSLAVAAVLSGAAASAQDASLKSPEELAALLKARIKAEWDIPDVLPDRVLACEQRAHKYVIFKTNADWNDPDAIVWEWVPSDALPADQAKWFGAPSECKPALGGKAILAAASGGGVALVRISDKKILFYGLAGGNTHSIAMFPDGNFVSASSTGKYLALFATKGNPAVDESAEPVEPTPVASKIEFPDAHGVVWDAKRQILWAHGGRFIVGYEYAGSKEAPELKEIFRLDVAGTTATDGHDLIPAPGYDALMTTGRGINVFDPETRTVVSVSKVSSIKSISLSGNGATLVQRAEEEWWSDKIYFEDAKDTQVGQYNGARFYKARWFLPNTFSEPDANVAE